MAQSGLATPFLDGPNEVYRVYQLREAKTLAVS